MANYSTTDRNAMATTLIARLAGGKLRIYSGAKPTHADDPVGSATLLAEALLQSPAVTGPVAGVLTLALPVEATITADGTAQWARVVTSGGAAVCDLTVGVTGSGSDLEVGATAFATGAIVTITAGTLTVPETA